MSLMLFAWAKFLETVSWAQIPVIERSRDDVLKLTFPLEWIALATALVSFNLPHTIYHRPIHPLNHSNDLLFKLHSSWYAANLLCFVFEFADSSDR